MPLKRAALVALVVVPTACGASIQAVYEGDVRFEHCMALDSRADIKPTIRRACWDEWQKFYTYGQTRDRVEFARLRGRQLSAASDFDEGDWAIMSARNSKAVPEPTSALAPPPMMLSTPQDGGAALPPVAATADAGSGIGPTATDAGKALPGSSEATPPSSECTAECEDTWTACRDRCRTPACEKACTGKYKRCMRQCF